MNGYSERDLGETRSRRAVLATAGGLLLPAGLLALDEEDAEATKRAKRRRRRKQASWWASDVIINFRNATSGNLWFRYENEKTNGGGMSLIVPGDESGFAYRMKPEYLTTTCDLEIELYDFESRPWVTDRYTVRCTNHDIGWPDAQIWWYPDPRASKHEDISGTREMGENATFAITHRGYRFHVHRWSNDKEPLDNFKEKYTRFFVTMSDA
jgi:hypothetical protein